MTASPTWWFAPRITVLSCPSFLNPEHLPVNFLGPGTPVEQLSEYAGRVCYMSQANTSGKTTGGYLQHILEQGHGSVLEHGMFSYLLEGVSRALTHELIRHRVGTAVSQLSQRYVDAADTGFVCPPLIAEHPEALAQWQAQCKESVRQYEQLVTRLHQVIVPEGGTAAARPARKQIREAARAVLPNCVETKLVWSCNLRELRHVLQLRGSSAADREIAQFAHALLTVTQPLAPHALADLQVHDGQGIISTLHSSN